MNCPRCGYENVSGRSTCTLCKTPLQGQLSNANPAEAASNTSAKPKAPRPKPQAPAQAKVYPPRESQPKPERPKPSAPAPQSPAASPPPAAKKAAPLFQEESREATELEDVLFTESTEQEETVETTVASQSQSTDSEEEQLIGSVPKPQLPKGFLFSTQIALPSLWRRLFAGGLDFVVLALLSFLFLKLFGPKSKQAFPSALHGLDLLAKVLKLYTPQAIFFFFSFTGIGFVYHTLCHGLKGKTPGKWLFGLTVVDRKGNPIGWVAAFSRSIAFLLFFYTAFVGVCWIIIDNEYRGLHDRISGSIVIRAN